MLKLEQAEATMGIVESISVNNLHSI